jgi:hypothetical protein
MDCKNGHDNESQVWDRELISNSVSLSKDLHTSYDTITVSTSLLQDVNNRSINVGNDLYTNDSECIRHGILDRQASSLTQIVSNCTLHDSKNTLSEHARPESNESRTNTRTRLKYITANNASFDDEKTTFSISTATTDPTSFVVDTPNTSSVIYTTYLDFNSEGESHVDASTELSMPLHWSSNDDEQMVYFRIVYRGVVPLLSAPHKSSKRNGIYLSYGEIVGCKQENLLGEKNCVVPPIHSAQRGFQHSIALTKAEHIESDIIGLLQPPPPPPPPRSNGMSQHTVLSKDTDSNKSMNMNDVVLKVEKLITGGYAMDAFSNSYDNALDLGSTPRTSNTIDNSDEMQTTSDSSLPGYLFMAENDLVVAEKIMNRPNVDEYLSNYKVVASVPTPILTGPSLDAPKTKAVLLPGTIVEVSLRVRLGISKSDITFLKLSHRRGWIADRAFVKNGQQFKYLPVAVEVTADGVANDESSVSGLSVVSTALSCVSTVSHRRHRPPRRTKEGDLGLTKDKSFPRQIASPMNVKVGMYDTISSDRLATPSSNVSILSFDSSFDHGLNNSVSLNSSSIMTSLPGPSYSYYFLMRVTAPGGLKILDAPQFQVNNLIRGKHPQSMVSSSHSISMLESNLGPAKSHHSIFQTMSSRLSTTGPSKNVVQPVFDASSKTRILPRGSLFEASRRMENTGAFSQGAGLIKLSDNSGWAIIPRQDELDRQYRKFSGGGATVKEGEATRAYEEVGNSIIVTGPDRVPEHWVRIVTRAGVRVYCTPDYRSDAIGEGSSSSRSSISASGSVVGQSTSNDSEIASSVASSFLDTMFGTPKKKELDKGHETIIRSSSKQESTGVTSIPILQCGCAVAVESWTKVQDGIVSHDYFVRLRGGQGWLPMKVDGKNTAVLTPKPEIRYGSYWFRVKSLRGIKVRLGPSQRAPSIKSDDGINFRFECGEFLRASEVMTIFSADGKPHECFAKLYRNRHIQLRARDESAYPNISSLTSQAEWVHVYYQDELFLEECNAEPRIERHKQGWRYNVVKEDGVEVRKGPSFSSEKTGVVLLGGESILINERVASPGDTKTWLRMKDGHGWVHDVEVDGTIVMIAHSLKYRAQLHERQRQAEMKTSDGKQIPYDAIIARLFHNTNGECAE